MANPAATPVPQPILDALTGLQADQDTITTDTATVDSTAAAAATADSAASAALVQLTADQTQLATDLAAFEALVQSTYGTAPPPAQVSQALTKVKDCASKCKSKLESHKHK